jgi:hypothetical protein
MLRTLSLATAFASAIAFAAMAQDTKTTPPAGAVTTPGITAAPTAAPSIATAMVLTEQEGKAWIDKPIYSSDGLKLGEVVVFQRDASNKVLGMHADIGGFLGYMQTRVKVMPAQFKLQGDRVVLEMTGEQAKSLPKVQS